jgi:sortase (surface protein transpeptidase)
MDRTRTDRILRWIERALVALGSVSLIWVGAISMHALTYQVEQNARLARLGPSSDHLAVDRSRDAVAPASEANILIGRLEIPRIGLSAVVMEGDDEGTLNVAVGHLPDTTPSVARGERRVGGAP